MDKHGPTLLSPTSRGPNRLKSLKVTCFHGRSERTCLGIADVSLDWLGVHARPDSLPWPARLDSELVFGWPALRTLSANKGCMWEPVSEERVSFGLLAWPYNSNGVDFHDLTIPVPPSLSARRL